MHERRWRIRTWAVAALAVALSFLGSAAAGAKTNGSAPSSRNTGHLTVVAVEAAGSWVGMDPFLSDIPPSDAAILPVWDPLFDVDPTTNTLVYDSLATGERVSAGGLRITITLRRGVTFQDGTPFNAAAVVWNLERYASLAVGSQCAPSLNVISQVSASGPYTVTIQLHNRDAGLIPLLATQQCALMVSPSAYQSEGGNFTNAPVGTGPFRYLNGIPGQLANFVRYKGYWGPTPHLNEITLQAVNSDSTAYDMVRRGVAQAWLSITDVGAVSQIRAAHANSGLVVQHGTPASITYVTFSFKAAPFNRLLARQAVAYATDPQMIDSTLYHDLYRPIQGIFPPASWAYSGGMEKGYPAYNLQKAAAAVHELGGLSFSLDVADTPSQLQLAEALQAQWQAAGIAVTLSPSSASTLLSSLHSVNYQALLASSPGMPDPDDIAYSGFFSTSALNETGLAQPQADNYILAGRSDYSERLRKQSYNQLNTYLSGLVPWDDVASTAPYDIISASVHGLAPSPYSLFDWSGVSIS